MQSVNVETQAVNNLQAVIPDQDQKIAVEENFDKSEYVFHLTDAFI